MKTIKEKVAVMRAYAHGEKIEFRLKDSGDDWSEVLLPQWDWSLNEYRVKPRPYRPFNDADEAFREGKKHGFWVTDGVDYSVITDFFSNSVYFCFDSVMYEEFVKSYTWADDNTPCGIEEGGAK